jgi:tetratricopeptide (TPR) repeat protein
VVLHDIAMQLYKEEEKICQELGDRKGLSRTFGNQSHILDKQGKLDEAMQYLKKQEKICRELSYVHSLAISLINQVRLINLSSRPQEALPLAEEVKRLAREHGYQTLLDQIQPFLNMIRAKLK